MNLSFFYQRAALVLLTFLRNPNLQHKTDWTLKTFLKSKKKKKVHNPSSLSSDQTRSVRVCACASVGPLPDQASYVVCVASDVSTTHPP